MSAGGTSINRNAADRNSETTVYVSQLDDKVTDALLWELMIQAAPVRHVYIPRNRITGAHFGYGFCEFHTQLDALYATKVLNLISLFSKPIRISKSSQERRNQDIGANLFIGNLVEEVDEKLLHDAFSAFGPLIEAPYIVRDPDTNKSKSYGFIKYSSFEHADNAITAMNSQYICNTPITVQYAFKKDSDTHERHGSEAERMLAEKAKETRRANDPETLLQPNTHFADAPPSATNPPPAVISAQRGMDIQMPPPPLNSSQVTHPGVPPQHMTYPLPQAPGGYQPIPYPPGNVVPSQQGYQHGIPRWQPDYQPSQPHRQRNHLQGRYMMPYAPPPPVAEYPAGGGDSVQIGWSQNRHQPRSNVPRPVEDEEAPPMPKT